MKEGTGSQLLIMIVGFLLTSVAGSFLTYYFSEKQWQNQQRHQLLEERMSRGQEIQKRILLETGEIHTSLNQARKFAAFGQAEEFGEHWKAFGDHYSKIRKNILIDRNDIARIYTKEVASMLYDAKGRNVYFNDCSMMIYAAGNPIEADCSQKRQADLQYLNRIRDSVNETGEINLTTRPDDPYVLDFYSQVRLASQIVERFANCNLGLKNEEYELKRCTNLLELKNLTNAHVNYIGVLRERLANGLYDVNDEGE